MINSPDTQSLIDLLKIPLSEIKFATYFCELILDQHTVGYLPVTIGDGKIEYDTNQQFIKKLDWSRIYFLSRKEIDAEIMQQLSITSFKALPIAFRRLYVEDNNGNLIASFTCSFESGSWIIEDEKLIHRDGITA